MIRDFRNWTPEMAAAHNAKVNNKPCRPEQKTALQLLIDKANSKAGKKKRATAFKHQIQVGRSKIMLTDEGLEQYTVAQWLRLKGYAGKFLHIPNERKCSVQEMVMLKALGLEPGAADFLIFATPPNFAFKGLAIEMKTKAGTLTEKQREWAEAMQQIGWMVVTCYGADQAIKVLTERGY